jgi:hypothetical protein
LELLQHSWRQGTFFSYRKGFDSMDLAFAAGRAELAQWILSIKSNLQSTSGNTTGGLESAVRICYETLLYIEHCPYNAEQILTFENFYQLCEWISLSDLSEAESITTTNLTHKNTSKFVYYMRHPRCLCSLKLASTQNVLSINGKSSPDSSASEQLTTAISLCSRNARIGDVVAVVRGCCHPLLLRPVHDRYELIMETYVYGFMKGEALERFPEVEIELV